MLDRLASALGPRGIQHYVFLGVLSQIESIANAYLAILADGGIQLALQGDEDADKIVKSVLVRAANGELRERGLSQLSGGQWRRVSMALDLAFAEVVRRRGALRCNMIVMDEVLTHLDASGREAVGSVLRALVGGTRHDDVEKGALAGAVDTGGTAGDSLPSQSGEVVADGPSVAISSSSSDELEVEADDGVTIGTGRQQILLGGAEDSQLVLDREKSRHIGRLLLGGGAYETVLVILQDLAAVEMEEAFDHVDVVVKDGDTAKVRIED